MKKTMVLCALFVVLVVAPGCMTLGPKAVDPRVFEESSKTIREGYHLEQAELELAEAYNDRELSQVLNGGSSEVPMAEAIPIANAPTVLFRNYDRYMVHATIKPVGVNDRVADRWDIEVPPGKTIIFPDDYPEATKFRCQNYGISYWRESSRGYSSSVQYYVGSFTVTPKKRGYDTTRSVKFNGGFDFTPMSRRN